MTKEQAQTLDSCVKELLRAEKALYDAECILQRAKRDYEYALSDAQRKL